MKSDIGNLENISGRTSLSIFNSSFVCDNLPIRRSGIMDSLGLSKRASFKAETKRSNLNYD